MVAVDKSTGQVKVSRKILLDPKSLDELKPEIPGEILHTLFMCRLFVNINS